MINCLNDFRGLTNGNPQKILDGSEEDFFNKCNTVQSVIFTGKECVDIEELLTFLKREEFNTVINSLKSAKKSQYFPDSYTGTDGLTLGYVLKKNLLIIVSFGEFQPQRYKIYVESVWELGSN